MAHRRIALITGASAGIGEAFADVFAAEGFDVVLVARREDRLRQVADRVRARHGVAAHVVAADLSREAAVVRLCDELSSRGLEIDALVNNAGYGVPGTFTVPSWRDHEAQMRVLVRRILRRHGYPPDKTEKATQTVLEQAELFSETWARA